MTLPEKQRLLALCALYVLLDAGLEAQPGTQETPEDKLDAILALDRACGRVYAEIKELAPVPSVVLDLIQPLLPDLAALMPARGPAT